MKVQALFKGSAKAAPAKKTAKSAPAKKSSSGKSSGGWLGSASGDINLDKWYVNNVIDNSDRRPGAKEPHSRLPRAQDKVG